MATLVLDRSNLELRPDGAALALYESGEKRGTIALNLLDRLVIQGNVKLEAAVLTRLGENGVATVLLSRRQSKRIAILLGPGHSDAAIRLAQYQLALDNHWCLRWARRTVLAKTRGHLRLLREAIQQRPACRKALSDAVASIEATRRTLQSSSKLDVATIRGLEGTAAAAFFRGYGALFPESLGFAGRNRRPPRDPVNACLSLGYTLLHFEAVSACHAAGLDPLIGFYHRPAIGRESMACDLVEPLRPRIDDWAWEMLRTRELRADSFVYDKGACLLGKAGRAHFYAAWEKKASFLRRFLRRQCAAIVRGLRRHGEPMLVDEDESEGDDGA
ncbi:MAG: CRISPR-associated endonuclease Cas1 [Steroidobacteraceae bacterium]|nr:CRISPR-associated endonuclease Cas1 [Steroidobacteraceae bacterium]